MRRYECLGDIPASTPLTSEEILELHAARILLLLQHCGVRQRIDGLTKMAKLDFFVRYPNFFRIAAERLGEHVGGGAPDDSAMIRYRYGPWDERYYQILSFLEAAGLIEIDSKGNTYSIKLTDSGKALGQRLTDSSSFSELVGHMKSVKRLFGNRSGNSLKNLIYEMFKHEVGQRELGERIQ